MKSVNIVYSVIVLFLSVVPASKAADGTNGVDLDVMNQIRDEGFNRSEIAKTLSYLTDVIGPRLTGSPALMQANLWTKEQLTKWGLENAHLEGFEFGPGWTYEKAVIHMAGPRTDQLYGLPIAWHPGTEGVLKGEVYYAPMDEPEDFRKYKGKLKGKIVFVDKAVALEEPANPVFQRRSDDDLAKARDNYRIPSGEGMDDFDWWVKHRSFPYKLSAFLAEEGAIAVVRRSPRGAMLIEAAGYQHLKGHLPAIPGVRLAAEHYNRVVRLLKRDMDVSLAIEVAATYYNDDMKSYSTFAEIPGKSSKPKVVLAGAHLDSWFEGDGAVDNGAGVVVVMEAMRILNAIGAKPKNTIRVALWGGEEQGYFGSQQYALDHLITRPISDDKKLEFMGLYEKYFNQFPMKKKAEFDRFSAYYNLDNGSGRIRGVYGESNIAAAAIFKDWLKPFHDIGAKTVSLNTTGGTDHEVFDDIGLPGFQFIQDPLDYGSRLHHTQMDTFDHAYEQDLKQAAVIMAAFLYNTAMLDDVFPRKPMPQKNDD